MGRLRRLLTRDLGRKLLALMLALIVWWRVSLTIQDNETIEFAISTTRIPTEAEFVLNVTVPDGWLLLEPAPGEKTVSIDFKGARVDLNELMRDGLSAKVNFLGEGAGQLDPENQYRVNRDVADFQWDRPDLARLLLANADNGEKSFTLEPSEVVTMTLDRSSIEVENQIGEGYVVALDEIRFSPNPIEIEGPRTEIAKLRDLAAGENPNLFEPIVVSSVPGEAIFDQRRRLSLSRMRKGLRLVRDEEIHIQIPIYPERLQPFTVVPDTDSILLIGEAPDGGNWSISDYGGTAYTVRYRHDPRIDPVPDEQWLRNAIVFAIDLSAITPGADTGYEASLDWWIRGASRYYDPESLQALKHAVTLEANEGPEGVRGAILIKN